MKKNILFCALLITGQFAQAPESQEVSIVGTLFNVAQVLCAYNVGHVGHIFVVDLCLYNRILKFDEVTKVDVALARVSGAAAAMAVLANAHGKHEIAQKCAGIMTLSMLGNAAYRIMP